MITKPTVLVLGAGASVPFKFPSGHQLLVDVCKALSCPETPGRGRIRSQIGQIVWEASKIPIDDLNAFPEALGNSCQTSVDAFLEQRTEFVDVGKAAMAAILLPAETESRSSLLDPARIHWYKYLLNRLRTNLENLPRNRLSFVTFNYDRSLEYFLVTAIRNSYGVSEERAAEALSHLPIVHVYGQLGRLPWQREAPGLDGEPVEYGAPPNVLAVRHCMKSMSIIHECQEGTLPESFNRARRLIEEAERVYFLGFGYHPANLERIGLGGERAQVKVVRGSAYQMVRRERREVQALLNGGIELVSSDCLGFLRQLADLD